MNRVLGRVPLPTSVIVPLLTMVVAVTVAALCPMDLVRRIGWSIGLLTLALLFIALTRMVIVAYADLREYVLVMVAAERIDQEWRQMNDDTW